MATVSKAYTMEMISGTEMIISTGSINCLHTINANDLDLIARKNQSGIKENILPGYIMAGVVVTLLAVSFLVFRLVNLRKKLFVAETQIETLNMDTLDREKIQQYIRENLSVASFKSIIDHFNTNKSQVYKLIEPEKPGSIIQKMRLEKVIEMRDEGKELSEIAVVTGLSESSIRKIKGRVNASD